MHQIDPNRHVEQIISETPSLLGLVGLVAKEKKQAAAPEQMG